MTAESLASKVEHLKTAYDRAIGIDKEIEAFLRLYRLALRMAKRLDNGD